MIKMNEELKYCKFCDKEKPKKDFCKSGSFTKNICRECQRKKQTKIYHDSKKVEQLQNNWNELKKWLEEEIKDYRKREWFPVANDLKEVLDKMQELEQGKDE